MSVYIRPCRGCPLRDGCDLKAEFAKRVAGLGMRSASFPCPKLGVEMRAGRRVVVRHPIRVDGWDDGENGYLIDHIEANATITRIRPDYRFACVIDPREDIEEKSERGLNVRFRRTMPHSRIVRFLDEPDGKFCSLGNLIRGGKCDTSSGQCSCKQLEEAAA